MKSFSQIEDYLHFGFESSLTSLFYIFWSSHVNKHKSSTNSWDIKNYLNQFDTNLVEEIKICKKEKFWRN